MTLLLELPTWLGDTIMSTPSIENCIEHYKPHKIILVGSNSALDVFTHHPHIHDRIELPPHKGIKRYVKLYRLSQRIGAIDLAISFRRSWTSRLFFYWLNVKQRYIFYKDYSKDQHQVLHYNDYINRITGKRKKAPNLKLYGPLFHYDQPTLGLNPGAAYGDAKRWYPNEFAKVAIALSSDYHIIIFGSNKEIPIAQEIEAILIQEGIKNYTNLAGQTSLNELIEAISGLDLFITNDSGPLHIAGAFNIETYAIFGPTQHQQTHQWNNPNEHIIRKELACAPCMKRTCPLKHHECMKQITSNDVLEAIHETHPHLQQ